MSVLNKKTFTVKFEDKEVVLAVKKPTPQQIDEAEVTYLAAFADAVKRGALLRDALEKEISGQKIWDEEKLKGIGELRELIDTNETKLSTGGIKLSEAKKLGVELSRARVQLRALMAPAADLNSKTAEGRAENQRFNHLVALCSVYNESGERVFKNLADYISKSSSPEAIACATELASLIYGLESDYEKNLPENKFLKKYGFVDEQYRLVNKDGHLVDLDGRLVDENGRFVDSDGNFTDIDGKPVDVEGNHIVEFSPFLDDDGNPVEE